MDRTDYKERLDEVAGLIVGGKKDEALELLEAVNWKKGRNVNHLLKASEYYEALGRLEQAEELLVTAHDRSPIGRMIIYRLALISIRLENYDAASEYYDEFVEIAPHDSLKYIIKYRLNEARGADENTLIGILEELRSRDLIEEWLFELACLYRKTSQVDKCIEVCDEIALWFGDGPYVEKALEMKMLYHPLDPQQEDQYRHFRQRKDGITEIRPEEMLGGSEIINRPITIPQVKESKEHFDTINLQTEIKRNIEEIMRATEAGEISENMEAIKELVEEIPYLKVPEKEETPEESAKEQERRKEREQSLRNRFSEYLAEEYDGQLSILVPERNGELESPIEGQVTISDILMRWEKTKRAAEAALSDAEAEELSDIKAKALAEANQIMDRLVDAMPKLDAGVSANELMKEEILSRDTAPEKKTFTIPKVAPEGNVEGVGLEIPVISADVEKAPKSEAAPIKTGESDTESWEPPLLNDEEQASRLLENVNEVLQGEIDRLSDEADDGIAEDEIAATDILRQIEDNAIADSRVADKIIKQQAEAEEAEKEAKAEQEEEVTEAPAPETEETAEEVTEQKDEVAEAPTPVVEVEPEAEPVPEVKPADKPADKIEAKSAAKPEVKPAAKPEDKPKTPDKPKTEEKSDNKSEDKAAKEYPEQLSKEEMEIFSYFTPIAGMPEKLNEVLNAERVRYTNPDGLKTGHILIQGGKGSGKTTLATDIVKILQQEGLMKSKAVGKIDGAKLNEKDIRALLEKIRGGCLIVENAGNISRDTAVTLSLLSDADTTGILFILEDSRLGIDRVLQLNGNFSAKFSQRIVIPILTMDELVNFGKAYASELGYMIDDTAVLALYDSINRIQRLDHPTYLTEIKEIVDAAIDQAERRKGIFGFGGKKYDENGNLILREKDFV